MRVIKTCTLPNCNMPHEAKGLCTYHYKLKRRKEGKEKAHAEYFRQYGHSSKGRFSALKRAANVKNLGMDITEEVHKNLTSLPCHYCGYALPETGHGLDRVDNSKGYLLNNVVPCCTLCNRVKGKWFDYDEFIMLAQVLKKIKNGRNGPR